MQSIIALSLFFTAVTVGECQLTALPVPPYSLFSQYHAQDELGQAAYGYAYPGQAASNFRDAWGNQLGSWAYIDPQGKHVRVSYVADSRGFRVLSNNLPEAPVQVSDTPEVEEAKRAHFAAVEEVKARNAAAVAAAKHLLQGSRRRRSPGRYYSANSKPVEPTYHAVPVVRVDESAVVQQTVPVTFPAFGPVPLPIMSKFHSQDEFGQAAFGHVTADQSASNFRDSSGNQMGHYAYINPDGQQIVVYYTAGVGGFRVISNALPQAPLQSQQPAAVQDTAEVAQARREHLALVEEARNRATSSL